MLRHVWIKLSYYTYPFYFVIKSQRIISFFEQMKVDFILSWLVCTVWWQIWNLKLAPICNKAPWMMFVMRMEVPGAMTRRSHNTAQCLLKHNALSSTSMTLHTHTLDMWSNVSRAYLSAKKEEQIEKKLHKMNYHIITGADFDIHTYMKINKFIYI